MKKHFAIILLTMAVALSAVSCKKHKTHDAELPENIKPPVEVTVMTVFNKDMADTYQAIGTVQSGMKSVLSPKVMGNIKQVFVEEGDHVTTGQLLAVIDSRDIAAQEQQALAGVSEARRALTEVDDGISAAESGLAAANANLELAEKTYQRFSKLREENSVSQQEFDQVNAQRKMAEAEASRAERSIKALRAKRSQVESKIVQASQGAKQVNIIKSFANVTAPFNGIVVSKTAEPGQLAAPGAPLFTIEDASDYRLEAQVEENFLKHIAGGAKVRVRIDALPQGDIIGKVIEITPSVDPSSRSFVVKIYLPPVSGLRSGLYGKAEFQKGERKILAVPGEAVVSRGQLTGVYTIKDGKARFRLVKTGGSLAGGDVEILSGINPGEVIVASNADRLTDGRKVVVEK